ncbi:MFS transporter [Streptomyces mashuensis]|uniref:MFS transporter n=1 Tax=Streptomyces mashuensis TaxID=33904 RepID=A0A919B121_9ACTN|nr:MFS transporter [Streptomyces mashuensis]GHF37146.1 MFS transporter [Streptomyces mashuensis]
MADTPTDQHISPDVPSIAPVQQAGDADGVLGRRHRALTLGIITVVSLVAFEASAVTTAMPVAARALDGIGLYAFAYSAFFTASLFAMVLSGEWCDRSGPLAPLFTGIAAFGAGLVTAGSAGAMWMFVAGRGVQGIGAGLVIVALYVVVGRAYPERLRPKVLASFSAAWVVPVIVGPLAAGTVTETIGWRWVFLAIPVLIVPPLVVMLPALRKLPPAGGTDGMGGADGTDGAKALDGRRIVLALAVAVGAGLLQYAGQDITPLSLLPAAAGLALLVPCVLRLLPRRTFLAGRGLPAVVLLRGLAQGSFLAAETFVTLMLVTERGLTPTLAGLSLTGGGLTWALGSYTQSRARLEPHRERLVAAGMLFIALGVALAPAVLAQAVPAWTVAVAWVIGGYGMGLTISGGAVLLLKLSRPGEEGANSASLQVSDALGSIMLVGLAGVLFVAAGGASAAPGATDAAAPPRAFLAVYALATASALAGAYVATRLKPPPAASRDQGPARGA